MTQAKCPVFQIIPYKISKLLFQTKFLLSSFII